MPTKTNKAKSNPKRAKSHDNLPTLREVLGRVKDKFNLIVYEGQRYWQPNIATEMDDWRFKVTQHELQLIEGVYDNREVCSFALKQPVKVGKKSIVLVEDDVEIRLLNVGEVNL